MIPVILKPEPACFDVEVRQRGARFLCTTPHPSSKEFSSHSYWLKVAQDMRGAYCNICAYTGCRIHADDTIDHFFPKVPYPHLAYEWSNYRLCMNKLNQRKSQNDTILDPFSIHDGWFTLDFPSCYVVAGTNLSQQIVCDVKFTIEKLKLNDNQLVDFRYEIVLSYLEGTPFQQIQKFYPFVAAEVARQGLTATLHTLFPRVS